MALAQYNPCAAFNVPAGMHIIKTFRTGLSVYGLAPTAYHSFHGERNRSNCYASLDERRVISLSSGQERMGYNLQDESMHREAFSTLLVRDFLFGRLDVSINVEIDPLSRENESRRTIDRLSRSVRDRFLRRDETRVLDFCPAKKTYRTMRASEKKRERE